MSSLRRRKASTGGGTSTPSTTGDPTFSTRKPEYADDGSMRMPMLNSPAQLAAARRMVRKLSAGSGRASTGLVSDGGVRPYTASLLGNSL